MTKKETAHKDLQGLEDTVVCICFTIIIENSQ